MLAQKGMGYHSHTGQVPSPAAGHLPPPAAHLKWPLYFTNAFQNTFLKHGGFSGS